MFNRDLVRCYDGGLQHGSGGSGFNGLMEWGFDVKDG